MNQWYATRPIAHRGLCRRAHGLPENSMAAFRACVEEGRPIELDVHLLRDGDVVVFHDDDLERLCAVRGRIRDLSSGDLAPLRLHFSDERIPLLSQVLEEVRGRVPLLIELKTNVYDGALEKRATALLRYYKGEAALQSFHPMSVYQCQKLAPQLPCGLLSYDYKDSDLPDYQRTVLRHAPFLPVLAPSFVALEWTHLHSPLASMARWLRLPLLAWTIRTPAALEATQGLCQNVIYEHPVEPV